MNAKVLNAGERKKFLAELNDKFGIEAEDLNYVFVETGKGKMRVFSGSLSRDEIIELSEISHIEIVGLYFARYDDMSGLRLSLDGTHLLGDAIKKNVFEVNLEQAHDWMRGEDLAVELERGVWVIKHGEDYLGCGFSNGTKMFNYIPRERKMKQTAAF